MVSFINQTACLTSPNSINTASASFASAHALPQVSQFFTSLIEVQPEYNIEILDPHHRHFKILRPFLELWKNGNHDVRIGFFDYLRGVETQSSESSKLHLHMTWLNDNERREYEGTLTQNDKGNLTVSTPRTGTITSGKWMFILMDEKFYFAQGEKYRCHHVSLSAGKPVSVAGTFKFENGEVSGFSLKSGHYLPEIDRGEKFLHYLKKCGFKIENLEFKYHSNELQAKKKVVMSVSAFLASCKQQEDVVTEASEPKPSASGVAKPVAFDSDEIHVLPKEDTVETIGPT